MSHAAKHDDGTLCGAREITHRTPHGSKGQGASVGAAVAPVPSDGVDESEGAEREAEEETPADLPKDALWHAARIDAVLVSESLDHALLSAHTCPAWVDAPHDSDHYPAFADFDLKEAGMTAPVGPKPEPKPGPPVFDPDGLKRTQNEKDELKRELNRQLGEAVGADLDAVGEGTPEERLERLSRIHAASASLVQEVAKEHLCMRGRGGKPTKPRNLPWQAKADARVARILAAWRKEPGGIPSELTVQAIEKLLHYVTAREAPEGPSPADESAEEATEAEPVHWGRKLLLSLVAEAIRLRDLPDAVCQGNILGITKSREWDGDIENNLRPITLQEVALKLTTGLLNARLSGQSIRTGS
eukprot:tig00020801_g13990.t1